ncbi:MAG: DUF167 domain-containing protein [Parvularcula sp.]
MTDTLTVKLRVTPKASRNEVGGAWEDPDTGPRLIVRVTAPPDAGKANAAVVATLAKAFGLSKSAVTLARGSTSRLKTVTLAGDQADLSKKLERLMRF